MMLKTLSILLCFGINSAFAVDFYSLKMKDINGKELKFSSFQDKVVMVVNIAMKDGYTSHLDGIQKLYKKYKDDGFVVVGVPSNEFGKANPDGNRGIKVFTSEVYGVTFPIIEKSIITGKKKIPLYEFLIQGPPVKEVGWNFTKFLVDRKGKLNYRYDAYVEAMSERVESRVRKLLKLNPVKKEKPKKEMKNQFDM